MQSLIDLFTTPMLNILLLLYSWLGHNFALAITVFTILMRVITYPLILPQMKSSKKMQELQPRLQELQRKYKDNKEKLAQAQMELYREAGVNPLGGCLPTVIQFPVWIGLYQSINYALGNSPLQLLQLPERIYPPLRDLLQLVPLQSHLLWLDLAHPDPYYILPVLVGVTMYLQQKMLTPVSTDPQTASMNQTMQLMMPVMFGFFTLQVSSGLAIYWFISNVVGVIIQYFTTGQGSVRQTLAQVGISRLARNGAAVSGDGRKAEALKAESGVRAPAEGAMAAPKGAVAPSKGKRSARRKKR